ncbi:MAG TPA: phosphate ABC transporter permease PstA [Burkholderiales bacterium]|nr:phosphate ABC transporter permease PstA [Burkholderiales bacterium]
MEAANVQEIRALISRHKLMDQAFTLIGMLAMFIAMITLAALFVDLVIDGAPRLTLDFFTSFNSVRNPSKAGILAAWVGTTLVMLVTASTGVLLGVAAGIYLEEYAPRNWVTDLIEINVTNLAGVPSIVYGLLGLGLFVYGLNLKNSVLTAGLTLALLILPIVIVATREAIRAVPSAIREAAYAVGATKWQCVSQHVVPYSTAGIMTGVIIGMARAIGETAPLIVIGAVAFIAYLPPVPFTGEPPAGVFDWLFAQFTVLPIQMFNWVAESRSAYHVTAAAAGVVIIVMTLAMNTIAIVIRYRYRKRIKW